MRSYRTLRACDPPLANQALAADSSIGLLLPRNVVVHGTDSVVVRVEFMGPAAVLGLVDNDAVRRLASDVHERMIQVQISP